ncbi:sporulation protein YqfC [Paramaledivibacter caminithermalis]|uniref:Sporulation protein YqfC n=1 Tax=Paramaledivibacter caminithermalis (strain DSM 15212 / CIP 107654 / DViRD3) TaxID=1121301 RepID=A0A1M6M767_PARC5|nr:sporulation protein YqfC [Paramaledivibacter caminithermalis]SHJ79309.1 sporulation protein YqfC [Paramaledivibacter caminithermalis DSM 15212]
MNEEKITKIKSNISNILEIPKEILLDLPKITFIGNLQVSIENHKGIIEYSSENIRVKIKDGFIKISGIDLAIKTIITEEIIISGKIASIDYYI